MKLTKLNDHLSEISGNIIDVQLGLIPNASQELCFFWVIFHGDCSSIPSTFSSSISLDFFYLVEDLPLDIWNNNFESKANNLSSDCKVDDLLLQPVGVDLESDLWCRHLFFVFGERLNGQLEDIKIGHDDLCE